MDASILNVKDLITVGSGGISFLFLLGLMWYGIRVLKPLLKKMADANISNSEIIRNNTEAIKEVSKSNENVAHALGLLDQSFRSVDKLLTKHDQRAEAMQMDIVKMAAKLHNMGRQ